ncbi:MAG TPA: GtrA family protein [Solirubrobacteraceae bacterium]|jgi:putative flippase GtrA|nr:GtrA family protein [Solirubrobacteraceae bacterium]
MNLSFILSVMPVKRSTVEGRAAGLSRLRRALGAPMVVQFMKFGAVGVSNTLLTFLVYTVLLKGFGVWYLAASAIGFVAGAVNGFLWNRRWTFKEHVGDALTPVRWFVVQGCGLGVNIGILYLLVHDAGVDKLVSQACATAIVTVLTFLANRAWTFRVHPQVAVADNDA